MTAHEKWRKWYENELQQPYVQKIIAAAHKLDNEYLLSPAPEYWLRVFDFPDISKIHTILVGSRPYHETYAADGFAFSSTDETNREMSLLYRKLETELGITYDRRDNSKLKWFNQGILPICMELTVPNGHPRYNDLLWFPFVVKVLRYFIEDNQRRVFIFLDKYSRTTSDLFWDKHKRKDFHLYLQEDIDSTSFLKRDFFSLANNFIKKYYNLEIDWT